LNIHRIILILLMPLTVSACGALTAPLSSSLKPGDQMPSDKVLVIGKFVLGPDVKQGSLVGMSAGRGTLREVIKLYLSKEHQEINPNALLPFSPEELIDVRYPGTSFLPMTPGIRYVRMGDYTISASGRFVKPASSSMRVASSNSIYFFPEIKLEIPANAKVVYIGTVTIHHDHYNATSVSVRDEHSEAMQQLAAMKLNNIKRGDVVKSLATVTGKPLQRKH
jgi:hypothetical protein